VKKRKKGHGGLKFLAIVGLSITVVVVGGKSEFGQRLTGKREDRRLERTALTPRFAYSAATLRVTEGSMYNEGGTPIDLTTSNDISIDRRSAVTSSEVNIARTPADAQGTAGEIPPANVRAAYTEILTKQYRYESPAIDGQPWFRWTVDPHFYGTPLDLHYIPMVDDIMGFELRGRESLPVAVEPASKIHAVTDALDADGPTAPATVTDIYSYELDIATFNRAVPILATRVGLTAPQSTPVRVTVGFDSLGLLRFADISMPTDAAIEQVQLLGAGRAVTYHYTLEVTDISGEPIAIDIPSDVADANPDTLSAALT
jgi:hypothetical protein